MNITWTYGHGLMWGRDGHQAACDCGQAFRCVVGEYQSADIERVNAQGRPLVIPVGDDTGVLVFRHEGVV